MGDCKSCQANIDDVVSDITSGCSCCYPIALARMQQRISELEQALVDDSLAKIMLEKMTTENEQLDIKLSGNIFHVFCQSFVRTFESAGAENYLTMEFHSDEIGDFTVTMQRSQGLTVYEKLKVVEQERDELAATVERFSGDIELAFYNGYVRGATQEREGTRNHAKCLPEIAEDECRKYLDFEFNSKY